MQKSAKNLWNLVIAIIVVVIIFSILYLLSPILLPFVSGFLLAYLFDPLVHRLMRLPMSRIVAVTIVFCCMLIGILLLVLFLAPLLQKQISNFIGLLPDIAAWLQTKMTHVMEWLDIQVNSDANSIKNAFAENILKSGGIVPVVLKTMLSSGKALFERLLNFILIPVVTFYLLRDWDMVLRNIRQLIPVKYRSEVLKTAHECDSVLSAFFRGQLLVMVALAIYYSIALTLLGLKIGIVIGLIVGITNIVPYLGSIIGILIAIIAALAQFGTLSSVVWVGVIFLVGHGFENFYLAPKLIGDRIGLHPVVVIFAILAGGTLFGFFGILLALPVAAIILVLIRNLRQRYKLHKAT